MVKIEKATTVRAVAKLVNENYVIRKVNEPDKRVYNLYTTDRAEAIKPELFAILDAWSQAMLDDFSRQDRETLLNLIEEAISLSK